MARNKTEKNGYKYARIRRKVGRRMNSSFEWVTDYKDFYGKTKKEAEEKYRIYMAARDPGRVYYFGVEMDNFIQQIFLRDPKYKETTKQRYVDAYNRTLRSAPISGRPLSDLKGMDLQKAYNQCSAAPSTIAAAHKLVRLFFRYAASEKICDDISVNVTVSRLKSKNTAAALEGVEVWTDEELKAIFAGSEGHRLRLLFVLGISTGCRISELLALRYGDIKEGQILITKQLSQARDLKTVLGTDHKNTTAFTIAAPKSARSVRSIPLSAEALEEIRLHKARHMEEQKERGYKTDYIFTTKNGRFIDRSSLKSQFKRFYKSIGIEYRRFHVFRHTFASKLAASGVPIQTVSVLLGHADIQTTAKYYVNIDRNEKINALAALKGIID